MKLIFFIFLAVCFVASFFAFKFSNDCVDKTFGVLFEMVSLLFLMLAILSMFVFLAFYGVLLWD